MRTYLQSVRDEKAPRQVTAAYQAKLDKARKEYQAKRQIALKVRKLERGE